MKTIYYVRHGQSEANSRKLFGGSMNTPLTELGREQAKTIGHTILEGGFKVDAVIASTLDRASDTAQLAAAEFNFPLDKIEYDDRLREINCGKFEGQEFSPDNIVKRDAEFVIENNQSGVESIGPLLNRLRSFKSDIEKRPEETIFIFSHAFVGRMFQRLFADIELTKKIPFPKNATLLQLYPSVELEDTQDLLL